MSGTRHREIIISDRERRLLGNLRRLVISIKLWGTVRVLRVRLYDGDPLTTDL